VTQLSAVLAAQKHWHVPPAKRRSKHLCADARYRGVDALRLMVLAGYIPHVQSRAQQVKQLQRHPHKPARRWIVEVAHSWFNRFRKLLVRHEKLERSFVALHHLAAAIIVFRKIPMKVNIIYG
jgi:IS5 family transposase